MRARPTRQDVPWTPHFAHPFSQHLSVGRRTMNPIRPLHSAQAERSQTQSGAALLECLLALLPILLVGSLCLELARGYQLRHLLTLSLQEAARVAAVHQGDPREWQPVLERSLSRLFIPAGRFTHAHARHEASRRAFQTRFKLPLWRALQVASDSDTIHLRLVYLHRPMHEWLRILLQAFNPEQHGLIPLVVDYRVLRQHSLKGSP